MFMLQHLLASGSRSSVDSCYLLDYRCLCCSIYWLLVVAAVLRAVSMRLSMFMLQNLLASGSRCSVDSCYL